MGGPAGVLLPPFLPLQVLKKIHLLPHCLSEVNHPASLANAVEGGICQKIFLKSM
jgi:hypothetical protein